MFWAWFISVGLIGSVLFRKKLGSWRRDMPNEALKGFALVGLFFFFVFGFLGLANRIGSVLWQLISCALSWAGILSAIELISRQADNSVETIRSGIIKERLPRNEPRSSTDFTLKDMQTTSRVWPPVTPTPPFKPEKLQVRINPVPAPKRHDPDKMAVQLLNPELLAPVTEVRSIREPEPAPAEPGLIQSRAAFLKALEQLLVRRQTNWPVFQQAGGQTPEQSEAADVVPETRQPPAPPVLPKPDLVDSPAFRPQVSSIFGSQPAATLPDSGLQKEPATTESLDDSKSNKKGFEYKPKLIDSKFGN